MLRCFCTMGEGPTFSDAPCHTARVIRNLTPGFRCVRRFLDNSLLRDCGWRLRGMAPFLP